TLGQFLSNLLPAHFIEGAESIRGRRSALYVTVKWRARWRGYNSRPPNDGGRSRSMGRWAILAGILLAFQCPAVWAAAGAGAGARSRCIDSYGPSVRVLDRTLAVS